MKFKNLYPYKTRSLAEDTDPLLAGKSAVDSLFESLSRIDVEEGKELNAAAVQGYVDECNTIIDRKLSINNGVSKLIVASVFAAKMELYRRTNQDQKIKKEFALFHRAIGAVPSSKEIPEEEEKFIWVAYPLQSCNAVEDSLVPYLNCALPLREGVAARELSVPDALTSASFVSGTFYNLAGVRKMFHELWQIESLQPLLRVMAHATRGQYCDRTGKIEAKEPLKIVFNDDLLRGYFDDDVTSGLSVRNIAMISLRGADKDGTESIRGDRDIKGTIIHELHHAWEKSFNNGSVLPYLPSDETAPAIKARMELMLKEAAAVREESCLEIISRSKMTGVSATRFQPLAVFDFVKSYAEDEKTRHVEIVVRVGNALGIMVDVKNPLKPCDEARAFEIMQRCGLTECIAFFREEVEMMRATSARISATTGLHFADTTLPFTEVPTCASYVSTPLHDAVRRKDSAAITGIITSGFDVTAKDSLEQSALELAMDYDDPAMALTFRKTKEVHKMLGENLPMLRRLANYLAAKSCEGELWSEEATSAFREMRVQSDLKSAYFFLARDVARDFANPTLVEEVRTMTIEDFESTLARREIKDPADILGNNFIDYCYVARNETLGNFIAQSYYTSAQKGLLLKCNSLQMAEKEKNPQKFLMEINAMVERGESLPSRLDMYKRNDSLLGCVAAEIMDLKKEEEAQLEHWLALTRRLVELGYDPFVVNCSDSRNFVDSLANYASEEVFAKVVGTFPTESRERAAKIFAERKVGGGVSERKESEKASGDVSAAGATAVAARCEPTRE